MPSDVQEAGDLPRLRGLREEPRKLGPGPVARTGPVQRRGPAARGRRSARRPRGPPGGSRAVPSRGLAGGAAVREAPGGGPRGPRHATGRGPRPGPCASPAAWRPGAPVAGGWGAAAEPPRDTPAPSGGAGTQTKATANKRRRRLWLGVWRRGPGSAPGRARSVRSGAERGTLAACSSGQLFPAPPARGQVLAVHLLSEPSPVSARGAVRAGARAGGHRRSEEGSGPPRQPRPRTPAGAGGRSSRPSSQLGVRASEPPPRDGRPAAGRAPSLSPPSVPGCAPAPAGPGGLGLHRPVWRPDTARPPRPAPRADGRCHKS